MGPHLVDDLFQLENSIWFGASACWRSPGMRSRAPHPNNSALPVSIAALRCEGTCPAETPINKGYICFFHFFHVFCHYFFHGFCLHLKTMQVIRKCPVTSPKKSGQIRIFHESLNFWAIIKRDNHIIHLTNKPTSMGTPVISWGRDQIFLDIP